MFFSLIGVSVRIQMVEAAEEKIPARREMERKLETAPVPWKHGKMEEDGIR